MSDRVFKILMVSLALFTISTGFSVVIVIDSCIEKRGGLKQIIIDEGREIKDIINEIQKPLK